MAQGKEKCEQIICDSRHAKEQILLSSVRLALHLQFHAARTVESAVGVNDVISLQVERIKAVECFVVSFLVS